MPKEVEHISWIDAQIYVVDIFLHFMAKRGYTLQKARHSIEFNNLDNEIKEMRSYMIKQLEDALQSKDEQ